MIRFGRFDIWILIIAFENQSINQLMMARLRNVFSRVSAISESELQLEIASQCIRADGYIADTTRSSHTKKRLMLIGGILGNKLALRFRM